MVNPKSPEQEALKTFSELRVELAWLGTIKVVRASVVGGSAFQVPCCAAVLIVPQVHSIVHDDVLVLVPRSSEPCPTLERINATERRAAVAVDPQVLEHIRLKHSFYE